MEILRGSDSPGPEQGWVVSMIASGFVTKVEV